MITLSIQENGKFLLTQIQRKMAEKGLCLSTEVSPPFGDFLFLKPRAGKHCDILLLHEPGDPLCCWADSMTILNTDRKIPSDLNPKSLIITYGLNSLSTVTASSLKPEPEGLSFSCCLQRSIVTLKGNILEAQEFPVFLPSPWTDISAALGFVALGLVLSFSPEEFCQKAK